MGLFDLDFGDVLDLGSSSDPSEPIYDNTVGRTDGQGIDHQKAQEEQRKQNEEAEQRYREAQEQRKAEEARRTRAEQLQFEQNQRMANTAQKPLGAKDADDFITRFFGGLMADLGHPFQDGWMKRIGRNAVGALVKVGTDAENIFGEEDVGPFDELYKRVMGVNDPKAQAEQAPYNPNMAALNAATPGMQSADFFEALEDEDDG